MFNPFKKKRFEIDDFAKLVITEAKEAGIAESLEYDPTSCLLKRRDQRIYLVNLLDDYCQANAGEQVAKPSRIAVVVCSARAAHDMNIGSSLRQIPPDSALSIGTSSGLRTRAMQKNRAVAVVAMLSASKN